MDPDGASSSHQANPLRRARLRWRARRGLLENDLILTRFLDCHEHALSDDDVIALDALLELADDELMNLILARKELEGAFDTVSSRRLIDRLRAA